MNKRAIFSVLILLVAGGLGYFLYSSEVNKSPNIPFKLGLDLAGGTHLLYRADVSALGGADIDESMDSLRDVIERRVNLFGVSEPVIQVQKGSGGENRLAVELPGVTNVDQAIALIGLTPVLEFKVERPNGETQKLAQEILDAEKKGVPYTGEDPYLPSPLTGRFIQKATVQFGQAASLSPVVSLEFNSEGSKLFADLTEANVGKTIAIYLDGFPISAPVVQEEITGGKAQISGNFTLEQARELVGRLNSGALPVPIELVSTQTIGASLGDDVFDKDVKAGIYGFVILSIFLILWYRLPGVIAVVALMIYTIIMLTLFKLIPVVLTAAGIAGLILSIGMAVDANILIFERMKEEIRKGSSLSTAMHEGFARAWPSIRDSNIASLITASVLFWMGTSLVKGFALTFGLGVLVSMFTAITVTRTFLYGLNPSDSPAMKFLFSNGFTK